MASARTRTRTRTQLPQELFELNQWLCTKKDQPKKPVSPVSGRSNDWNQRGSWTSYKEALEYKTNHGFEGLGFVFTSDDPYLVLDLDDALVDGKMRTWARDIVEGLNTYTERSMSGEGLHCIVKLAKPPKKLRTKYQMPGGGHVEAYYENRFVVLTGKVHGKQPKPIREVKESIISELLEKREVTTPDTPLDVVAQGARNNELFNYALELAKKGLDEDEVYYLAHVKNDEVCRPALPDKEVETIVRSAMKRGAPRVKSGGIDEDKVADALSGIVATSSDFLQQRIPKPRFYLKPWLSEGSITQIHGARGAGKTWLSLIVATMLTREEYRDHELGSLIVKTPVKVLMVDGEMRPFDIQQRLKALAERFGPEHPDCPLQILSNSQVMSRGLPSLNIADEVCRNVIERLVLGDEKPKVLILDNIASLAPGIDENAKRDWDPINQWLLSLRHAGVAVVFVHHEGKNRQQRGTSGREDNLDTVIQVTSQSSGFQLKYTKARNMREADKKPIAVTLVADPLDNKKLLIQANTNGADKDKELELGMALAIDGHWKQKQIAEYLRFSQARVSQLKKNAKDRGFLNSNGALTEAGHKFVNKFNLEDIYAAE